MLTSSTPLLILEKKHLKLPKLNTEMKMFMLPFSSCQNINKG